MIFILPEMLLMLLLGRLGFGIPVLGSLFTLSVVIVVGAMAFSGIGLRSPAGPTKRKASLDS